MKTKQELTEQIEETAAIIGAAEERLIELHDELEELNPKGLDVYRERDGALLLTVGNPAKFAVYVGKSYNGHLCGLSQLEGAERLGTFHEVFTMRAV